MASNRFGADVRGDPESLAAYEKIVSLLLAGGYFRARIQTLSPFDKVIGGMAWSITAAAGDLDIDILFQEEAQIGQKVRLGEQVLAGLDTLQCPLALEPFQLQGLDFKAIFPVIQWLVKKVIEVREETGDLVRAYSVQQFSKRHTAPQDAQFHAHKAGAAKYVCGVQHRYRPRRRYARQRAAEDEEEEVHLTLLEYGSRIGGTQQQQGDAKKKRGDDDREERIKREEEAHQQRMQQMAEVQKDMSANAMHGYIPKHQIQSLMDAYEAGVENEEALPPELAGKKLAERQHQTKLAQINRQIDEQKQQSKQTRAQYEAIEAKVQQAQAESTERQQYVQRIKDEIAQLDALETPENSAQLAILKELVALNDNLKAQEAQFRQACKEMRAELLKKIADLEKALAESEDGQRERAIEEAEIKDGAKLLKIREMLAQKNRDMAMAERKIDEIPSRSELQQYQRQLYDLYDQIVHREVETRRYYNTFNTLADTLKALESEQGIYDSILENYQNLAKSRSGRDQFARSMEELVKNVNTSLEKVLGKLDSEKILRNEATDKYHKLIDTERKYFKLAKDFQLACKQNEMLVDQLGEGGAPL